MNWQSRAFKVRTQIQKRLLIFPNSNISNFWSDPRFPKKKKIQSFFIEDNEKENPSPFILGALTHKIWKLKEI